MTFRRTWGDLRRFFQGIGSKRASVEIKIEQHPDAEVFVCPFCRNPAVILAGPPPATAAHSIPHCVEYRRLGNVGYIEALRASRPWSTSSAST